MPLLITFLFVSHFWVIVYFNKKHHYLKSLSHSLIAQNICKAFFINMIIMGNIYGKYCGFVNCSSLWQCWCCFFFQVVQTNNNDSSWRGVKKSHFLMQTSKNMQTCQENRKSQLKKVSWQDTQANSLKLSNWNKQKSQPSSSLLMHNKT